MAQREDILMNVQETLSRSFGLLAEPRWRMLLVGMTVVLLPFASLVVASVLERYLDVYAPNMIFLCSVILAAIWQGRAAALLTAAASFLVYNYYLSDPHYTLHIHGLNDLLTLAIFVMVALSIGGLAGTIRDERNRAREQVRILSELFKSSQEMAGCSNEKDALCLLVDATHRLHGGPAAIFERGAEGAVLVYGSPGDRAPPTAVIEQLGRFQAGEAEEELELPANWQAQMISTGAAQVVLVWQEAKSAQRAIATGLLVKLAQAAIERVQAAGRQLAINTMEATDRLRTALLSSISHDFRTPLATITASASSLLTYGGQFSEGTRVDLLTSIQEEAERLSRFVGNVLDMTRLEAKVLKPRSEWTDPLDIMEIARDRLSERLGGRQLSVKAPAALPAIEVDPVLLEQALINVLDNAVVHTPPESSIQIGASHEGESLRLWVEDDGEGVAPSELETIFDKFHRRAASGDTTGLGLGLAISKGLVEAMNGSVSASSPVEGVRGLRVEFVFPCRIQAEPT